MAEDKLNDKAEEEKPEKSSEKNQSDANKKGLLIVAIMAVAGIASILLMNMSKTNVVSQNAVSANVSENLPKMTEEEFLASWDIYDSDLSSVSVGDVVNFGRYETDGNSDNYLEVLEWDVLAVSDNSVLLISHKVIDERPYNVEIGFYTWESCELRQWLNNDFIEKAFNDTEKPRIKSVSLNNPDTIAFYDPFYAKMGMRVGTVGCDVTTDKVFLLDYQEVIEYYNLKPSDRLVGYESEALFAEPAATLSTASMGYSTWWLRSSTTSLSYCMYVSCDFIQGMGSPTCDDKIGIRPAMWVTY